MPVQLRLAPLETAQAREIRTWRYPAPYDCYDMTGTDAEELVTPEAGFFALLRDGELVGFRSFGPDGRVPGWSYDDAALDTGGGLRPDLVGQGLGRTAIAAGLTFGRERFDPPAFRVTVASFNVRALTVVESLGFERTARFHATGNGRSFEVLVRPER